MITLALSYHLPLKECVYFFIFFVYLELPIILYSGGHRSRGYADIEDSHPDSKGKVRTPSYQEPPPSAYQSSPSPSHDVNDQGQSEA